MLRRRPRSLATSLWRVCTRTLRSSTTKAQSLWTRKSGAHAGRARAPCLRRCVLLLHRSYRMVRACKWVDEVVEDTPYVTTLANLKKYDCQICAHGDDIATDANGRDSFAEIRQAGMYRCAFASRFHSRAGSLTRRGLVLCSEFKRTQGVSTTDLINRVLLKTKTHFVPSEQLQPQESVPAGTSTFISTTHRLLQFSSGRAPKVPHSCSALAPAMLTLPSPSHNSRTMLSSTSRVLSISSVRCTAPCRVVCSAALLTRLSRTDSGHVDLLEKAHELGTFVVAGIHNDQVRCGRGSGLRY
jgi:ethanolamine-phosphate cytidylyltransferase